MLIFTSSKALGSLVYIYYFIPTNLFLGSLLIKEIAIMYIVTNKNMTNLAANFYKLINNFLEFSSEIVFIFFKIIFHALKINFTTTNKRKNIPTAQPIWKVHSPLKKGLLLLLFLSHNGLFICAHVLGKKSFTHEIAGKNKDQEENVNSKNG